jgi:hypothetical protein
MRQSNTKLGSIRGSNSNGVLIFSLQRTTEEEAMSINESNSYYLRTKTAAPSASTSASAGLLSRKRRMQREGEHEDGDAYEPCERRASEESSRAGSPQDEDRHLDTDSGLLSPPLKLPLLSSRAPLFVPRRKMRVSAPPPPVFCPNNNDSHSQGQGSSSLFRYLMMPFSHQDQDDGEACSSQQDAESTLTTHAMLFHKNVNGQSLLDTTQDNDKGSMSPHPLTNGVTARPQQACVKLKPRRSQATILPRSSSIFDPSPAQTASALAPFSGVAVACASFDDGSQNLKRDQSIFRSPVDACDERTAPAAADESMAGQVLAEQKTPKSGVELNTWTNLNVPQHKVPEQRQAADSQPQSSFFNQACQPSQHFQTPAQLQSFVPLSAWNHNATNTKKQLESLRLPSLALDGEDNNNMDNDDCEMRDCEMWCAIHGPSIVATDTARCNLGANLDPFDSRDNTEGATSTTITGNSTSLGIWAELALKASHTGSLLGARRFRLYSGAK